jgi:hypothetical protein
MLDEMGLPREDRGRPTLHTCKACGEQYDKSVKGAFYKHLDDCSTLKKRRAEMEARDAAWEGETRRLKADPKWSTMTELEQMHAINRQLPPTPEQEAEWEQIKVNQVGHSLDNLEANIEHLIREEARFTPAYYDRLQCLAGQLTAFLARRVS